MANINDVYNRLGSVDNTLGWIYTAINAGTTATKTVDTDVKTVGSDVKAGTTATVNALTTLDNDVKAGTVAVVDTLKVIAEIELAVAGLLFHLTQQADTMICELGQISKNTCGILTQVTIQTELQKIIRNDLDNLLQIEESVHPEAGIQLARLAELRAQVEKCCPPKPPEPACTYVACPAPTPVTMPPLPVIKGTTGGDTNQAK
jgi:hypothetical protein